MTSPPKKYLSVNGKKIAYIELGQGDPIVFLHGNPTSSFLWRHVMPELEEMGRLIAPDLIGMGDSDKLDDVGPGTYTFSTHQSFLDGFFQAAEINGNVTLVLHDWGSGLGLHWANRNRDAVKAIAYMEALVRPFPDWNDWDEGAAQLFQALRSDAGEKLVLENNVFVERILPGSILRQLTDEEMAEYRRPYAETLDRWPTLSWPRSIPVSGEPAEVHEIIANYAQWMTENDIPKLFVNAEPAAILTGAQREFCRSWKNQTEITVKGSHFIQEDSGAEIGRAIKGWLGKI